MAGKNRSKIPIGTILEGKFRITKEIGRGGMAAVYEAENVDIGKRVAVKILAAELITSRVVRERFIREARASAAVRSPYICDVYDSGMFEERPFLVMELLEGESLYDLLTRVRRLDVATTLTVATHTARGLGRAHESNIVHRDLKPENIFLTRDEEGQMLAKILDFGLAKFYEPTAADEKTVRLTREGALFGTPAYMSPEQAKGQGEVDHRADLWALGCIVYECLTAHTVWNVEQGVAMILAQIAGAPIPRPSKLRPDLPKSFDDWFVKALDRHPEQRFQSAREFADSLSLALTGTSPQAHSSLDDEESAKAIDELISKRGADLPQPEPAPLGQGDADNGVQLPTPAPIAPDEQATIRPAPLSGASRAIALLLVASAIALGGYATWLYVLHPPGGSGFGAANGEPDDSDPTLNSTELKPAETEPYALQISAAQEWLARGETDKALTMFKEAFQNGGARVARSLLAHAEISFEEDAGAPPCRVTGLGRPRPFELVQASSRPSVAVSPHGIVAVWGDTHQDGKRTQVFAVALDQALRRVSPAHLVTPEANSVYHPQIQQTGDQLGLVYWDSAGTEPGVYVRLLTPDGRIASPARRISESKRHQFYPALARTDRGTFWAVWEEQMPSGSTDLVARRLSSDLEPLAEPVRLTALSRAEGFPSAVSMPDAAITNGHLYIVFSVARAPKQHQVMLLRVTLDDPALAKGIGSTGDGDGAADVYVGTLHEVSRPVGKNTQARLACAKDGCIVVWDDETAGALAAYIDEGTGEPL